MLAAGALEGEIHFWETGASRWCETDLLRLDSDSAVNHTRTVSIDEQAPASVFEFCDEDKTIVVLVESRLYAIIPPIPPPERPTPPEAKKPDHIFMKGRAKQSLAHPDRLYHFGAIPEVRKPQWLKNFQEGRAHTGRILGPKDHIESLRPDYVKQCQSTNVVELPMLPQVQKKGKKAGNSRRKNRQPQAASNSSSNKSQPTRPSTARPSQRSATSASPRSKIGKSASPKAVQHPKPEKGKIGKKAGAKRTSKSLHNSVSLTSQPTVNNSVSLTLQATVKEGSSPHPQSSRPRATGEGSSSTKVCQPNNITRGRQLHRRRSVNVDLSLGDKQLHKGEGSPSALLEPTLSLSSSNSSIE